MQSQSSPFGSLTSIVASILAVLVVGASVTVHLASALGLIAVASTGDVNFLDAAAGAVLLLLFGSGFGIGIGANGAKKLAQAAHTRLDLIGAPAAATSDDPVGTTDAG